MLPDTLTSIEITEVVFDRMNVHIKCPLLKKATLSYCISNINNQLVRKGSFLGECIQLNLMHVPDGDYFFHLSNQEGREYSLPFYKTSRQSTTISLREY